MSYQRWQQCSEVSSKVEEVPCKASCCHLFADKQSRCLSWHQSPSPPSLPGHVTGQTWHNFLLIPSQLTIYLKSMGSYIPRLAPWYWANPPSAKRTNECLEEDKVETFRCFSNHPLFVLGGPSLHLWVTCVPLFWILSFHTIILSISIFQFSQRKLKFFFYSWPSIYFWGSSQHISIFCQLWISF